MRHVPLKVCLFWAAFILAAFLAGDVAEAGVTGYYITTSLTYGTDSTASVDSANVYRIDGTNVAALDSADRLVTFTMKLAGYAADPLSRYTIDVPSSMTTNYNPAYVALWFMDDGQILRDNSPKVTHIQVKVDTTDQVLEDVSASGGTGPYPDTIYVLNAADSSAVGLAGVVLYDGSGVQVGSNNADANGFMEFSQLADTLFAYAYSAGFFQSTIPDTNIVTASGANDTIFMTTPSIGSPPSPGLTPVVFNFKDDTGAVVVNVVFSYKLESGGKRTYHMDSTNILDPSQIFSAKRSDTNGQVTAWVIPNDSIYVDNFRAGETRWRFWARSPLTGEHLLGKDGVLLDIPYSATALVWPKAF